MESAGEHTTLIDKLRTEAQRALQERPSLSVRKRISLGFFLWFTLSLGITIASLIILTKIQNKLQFMEAADKYTFEIQQARRFEKNYFLYGTNLDDALEHVHQAQSLLQTNNDKMASVIGNDAFQTMDRHIRLYEELLSRLKELKKIGPNATSSDIDNIADELRKHGAEMMTAAEKLVKKERQSVNAMIFYSKRVPIFFLLFLLGLMIYLAHFIARQILGPLKRLMDATRRIADGDITPITPTRRYRDEFTELALAMNHMMYQLDHRQKLLAQAHKLKAVGTLTAGVAHELNNPINNIMITAAMLLEDYKDLSDEERLDMINDLMEQVERSRKIVRNLLEFARESKIHIDLFQVEDLVQETLQLASNQIKLSKVTVNCQFSPNLPPVCVDKQQLMQVFLNLVLNALDAMPDGGGLTIAASNSKEGDYLRVEFTDTGIGISEHVLPRWEYTDAKPGRQRVNLYSSASHGKGSG